MHTQKHINTHTHTNTLGMQDNSGVTLEAVAMVRGAGGVMVDVTARAKEQTVGVVFRCAGAFCPDIHVAA